MPTPIKFVKQTKQFRYARDIDRMVAVMLLGGFSISREDAFDLWEYHSELLNQSWCDLPYFDNALYAIMSSYLHTDGSQR